MGKNKVILNVDASLLRHTRSTVVPRQVTVIAKEGGTSVLALPHDTSLLIYADEKKVPRNRVDVGGLQVLPLPETLCKLGPQSFRNHPREAGIALNLVRDPGELLSVLLAGDGMAAAAGRLAGALRFVGHHRWYGELFAPAVTVGILESHQLAGYRNGRIGRFLMNAMLASGEAGEYDPAVTRVPFGIRSSMRVRRCARLTRHS